MTIKSKPAQFLTALPLILILSSCQNIIGSKASSKNSTVENDPANPIVSTYTGGQVTLKNVNEELKKFATQNEKFKGITFNDLNSDQKEALIKEVALKQMFGKEALKRNLDKDADYQEALTNFESELLKQKLLIALTKDATNDAALRKNYDEIVEKLKGKKDIRISYIAVKTKKEAEEIYRDLRKSPKIFAAQAKKKSLDKDTAKKGGDLGFALEDALPADVLAQAKLLEKGQISQPFSTSGKWVIIKLDGERLTEVLPFEKAKEVVAQNLAKKAIEDFVKESLEKAKIDILVK